MKKIWLEIKTDVLFWVLTVVSGLMVFLMAQAVGFTIGPDGNDYVGVAFQLFDPHRYGAPTDYVGPFYAGFLRLLFALGGGVLFNIFHHYLPAFFVPLIIYFALKPFYQPAAFLCGLFVALDVNSMFHFACICSEAPYIFWLACVLLTFCRLLQNPQHPSSIYWHALSLVMLTLTRAAGRLLFFVLVPFYAFLFRSKKLLVKLTLVFFIPLTTIALVLFFICPMTKFPSAIVPLTFFRAYGMVNPQSENLHRMLDEAERIYFEHPLSPEAKQLLVKDLLECNYYVSNMLFDVSWAPHSSEFDRLISGTVWETVRSLKVKDFIRIFKIYKHGIYIHSEFTPVPMIYTNIFPYDGNRLPYNCKGAIDGRLRDYESRYGMPISKAMADHFYKKYCPINYEQFNQLKPQAWAVRSIGFLSCVFPFLVQRWVFFFAVFFLFVKGRAYREYRTVAVFGIILFLYNYALTMLFGPHERYRAPMDMFYFIPTAWFYAYLIFDKDWKSPWKIVGWILVPVAIAINIHEISPILRDWYLQTAFLSFWKI